MPGIGCNIFSVKSATKKGVVFIFNFDNPRLELSGITIPLRAEDDDLYYLVFGLSADSHEGKELAMNAMTNAQPVAPPAGTPQREKLGAHAEA